MRRRCHYHAGCPDGFGAAWAVWRTWGDRVDYVPRGHDDPLPPAEHEGAIVAFVDIAPDNDSLRALCEVAEQVIVLDHHVSARDRYEAEPGLAEVVEEGGHCVHFELAHSGATLAWRHFHGEEPLPGILAYVEDQDLWRWKLPRSEEVNAAIASYPRRFETWEELADRPWQELAVEGEPIVRANRMIVEQALHAAHPVALGTRRIEGVNATHARSSVGHELAKRATYGSPWGLVYRLVGERVHVSLYSIGDLDVARVATEYGGGGHRNAAGFTVPLRDWLRDFV